MQKKLNVGKIEQLMRKKRDEPRGICGKNRCIKTMDITSFHARILEPWPCI